MQADFNQVLTLAEGTNYSNAYQIDTGSTLLDLTQTVQAIAGSGASIATTIETSHDKDSWTTIGTLDAMTAQGSQRALSSDLRGYVRFKLVLSGTTPTATVNLEALAKAGQIDPESDTMPQTFEDTSFVTGDGATVLNVESALGKKATEVIVLNDGEGDFTVALSEDAVNYSDEFRLKDGEFIGYGLSVARVRLTPVSDASYRVTCV